MLNIVTFEHKNVNIKEMSSHKNIVQEIIIHPSLLQTANVEQGKNLTRSEKEQDAPRYTWPAAACLL